MNTEDSRELRQASRHEARPKRTGVHGALAGYVARVKRIEPGIDMELRWGRPVALCKTFVRSGWRPQTALFVLRQFERREAEAIAAFREHSAALIKVNAETEVLISESKCARQRVLVATAVPTNPVPGTAVGSGNSDRLVPEILTT